MVLACQMLHKKMFQARLSLFLAVIPEEEYFIVTGNGRGREKLFAHGAGADQPQRSSGTPPETESAALAPKHLPVTKTIQYD